MQLYKIRNGIRNEILSYGAELSEHELPDWALRLLLRNVKEEVEQAADMYTTAGQKRKLYEESRKTKNITTWKLLSNCKGYLSKPLKSRHKGTLLHNLYKITGGDILCATQLWRAISKDHPFKENLTDCRTDLEKKNDNRKLSYIHRMNVLLFIIVIMLLTLDWS